MSPTKAYAGVRAMRDAARPYLETMAAADEVSRNVASALAGGAPETPEEVAREMLVHRIHTRELLCGDVQSCARVMGLAWRHATTPLVHPLVLIEESAAC